MSNRPLVYAKGAKEVQLANEVKAVLPKLAARMGRYRPRLTCPVCGGSKSRYARRCRICRARQIRVMQRIESLPTLPTSFYGTSSGRWRGGKVGKRPDQPDRPFMVKQADGTWKPEEAPEEMASTYRQGWSKEQAREWAATHEGVPPSNNSEVARVMQEMGVGRRHAYKIVRERTAKSIDTSGVGQGQRIAVLACLIAKPEAGETSFTLLDALHDAGVRIDIHDVNKTLWALNKTGFVKFRNGANMLRVIKATPAGLDAYGNMIRPSIEEALIRVEHDLDRKEAAEKVEEEVAEESVPVESVPADYTVGQPTASLTVTFPAAIDWNGYPVINSLILRAERAEKIEAAAKLLEEAGEDDTALDLMGKYAFTPLETEVIRLRKEIA